MKLKSLILFYACSLAACSPKKPAESSNMVEGTKAERIAEVSRIIARSSPPPGPLLDAYFIEEQTGDGRLGPSDFKSFCVLKVAPADLPAWKAALAPLEAHNMPPAYVSPKNAAPWWLTATEFANLEFRSSKSLTGRVNGWVGIAPDGRIFVYSFTM
jgi:hypothetical protein